MSSRFLINTDKFNLFTMHVNTFKLVDIFFIITTTSESYHHSAIFIVGGFSLCRLGVEGGVTAAPHQQGCV